MSSRHERVRLNADWMLGSNVIAIDKDSELLKMIRNGRATEINKLLCLASYKGSIKCVKVLLDHGADINHIPSRYDMDDFRFDYKMECPPLIEACLTNNVRLLELLIERGLVINDLLIHECLTSLKWRALGVCNNKYNLFLSNLLVHINDIDFTYNGVSFLHQACELANIEIVRVLLMRGAHRGDHALAVAARRGYTDIVRLLVSWNHQVLISIDSVNQAFIAAATSGALDVVRVLNDYRANAYTAALFAVTNSDELSVEVAEFLLERGADFHATDNLGRTAWQILYCSNTYYNGYNQSTALPLAQIYLERGADANAIYRSGDSLLLHACGKRDAYFEFASLFLEYGAYTNYAHPTTGETPLMRAALAARSKLVRLLLENGADVLQVNASGQTVLDLMGTQPKYAKVVDLCSERIINNKPILK